ncbi:hypothetical protein CRUP_004765 [Coryphaenoides rupestris]|nr:hypothetical protein CRUP_004765 [Coryphaenoides rupestris]
MPGIQVLGKGEQTRELSQQSPGPPVVPMTGGQGQDQVLLADVLLLLCDVTTAGETQEEDSLDQLTLNKSLVAPRLPNSVPGFPVTRGYWDNQHQVVVLKVLLADVLLLLCDVTSAGETQEEDSLDQLTLNQESRCPHWGYWDNQHQII